MTAQIVKKVGAVQLAPSTFIGVKTELRQSAPARDAAELAVYILRQGDAGTVLEAARIAAAAYGADVRNVHKYVKRLTAPKTVLVPYKGKSPILRGITREVPFLDELIELDEEGNPISR